MRGDTNVIGLGHRRDLLCLGDTTRMGDIRLGNVDTSLLLRESVLWASGGGRTHKVRSVVFSGEEPFSELSHQYRTGDQGDPLTAIGMLTLSYKSFISFGWPGRSGSSMKSGRCGSRSLASCLAMGLCRRPWKSLPVKSDPSGDAHTLTDPHPCRSPSCPLISAPSRPAHEESPAIRSTRSHSS